MEEEEYTPFLYMNTKVKYLTFREQDVDNALQENNQFVNKPGVQWLDSLPGHFKLNVQHPEETIAENSEPNEFFLRPDDVMSCIVSNIKTGYEMSVRGSHISIGKSELSVDLGPYGAFRYNPYGATPPTTIEANTIRLSNKWKNRYFLDFNKNRFVAVKPVKNGYDYSYKIVPDITECVVGSPEYYKTIRENVIKFCMHIANAISESADCAQLQPRQRGSHKICNSCDYQLMCTVRT